MHPKRKGALKSLGFLAIILILLALPSTSNANIVMEITGSPGSADVTMSISGTLTYNGADAGGSSNKLMAFPVTNFNQWFPPTGLWGGDLLWNTTVPSVEVLANSSDLMLSITGDHTQNFTFDSFSMSSNSDGFLVPSNSSAMNYPALAAADIVITVSGSATLTLPSGITFDNLNLGTRTSSYSYAESVTQSVTGVPEPTSFAMFGIAIVGLSRRRRLK